MLESVLTRKCPVNIIASYWTVSISVLVCFHTKYSSNILRLRHSCINLTWRMWGGWTFVGSSSIPRPLHYGSGWQMEIRWCSPSGCKAWGLTFLTAEVMVHTFNCRRLFIFTNNSSKPWVWERKAVVSDKRKWFSSGGNAWALVVQAAVMCRQ